MTIVDCKVIVDYAKIIVDVMIVDCEVIIVDCNVIIVDWDDKWRWVNCATNQLQLRALQYTVHAHTCDLMQKKLCCNWISKWKC